jgi:hypothetical protein
MLRSIALIIPLALAAACGGGGGSSSSSPAGTGTLKVVVTDAPIDHAMVSDARIWVDKVTVHQEADADTGFLTLYDGAPVELDLLHLENGVVETLAQADVPAGNYRQLRLFVDHGSLTLVNGHVYTTVAGTLSMPSAAQSGFKVFVDPPLTVEDGVSETLLLDFDLSKTFHPIPASDPLAATSYSLHPVIRAANLSTSGELRGVVRQGDGAGGLVPVADATVYAMPPGASDVENAIASTGTGPDGSYAILGLPPGTIDVLATKGLLDGRVEGEHVSAGSVTVVDVVID